MSDRNDQTSPGHGAEPVGQRPDQGTRLTNDPGEAQADEALGFSDAQTVQGQPSDARTGDPRQGGGIDQGDETDRQASAGAARGDSQPGGEGAS